MAIETSSRIKAIDKGCPILQTMALTIHDKARVLQRTRSLRAAKRSSSAIFTDAPSVHARESVERPRVSNYTGLDER